MEAVIMWVPYPSCRPNCTDEKMCEKCEARIDVGIASLIWDAGFNEGQKMEGHIQWIKTKLNKTRQEYARKSIKKTYQEMEEAMKIDGGKNEAETKEGEKVLERLRTCVKALK